MLNAGCRSTLACLVPLSLCLAACSLDRGPELSRPRPDGGAGTDGGPQQPGDSCGDDNGGCSPLVTCELVNGRVRCGACPEGTQDVNDDGSECADIDECELGIDECDRSPQASCINTMRGYRCRCPEGTGDPTTGGRNCVVGASGPVDECELEIDDCDDDPKALCTDDPVGFTCTCPEGYADEATHGTSCVDIDECELGTDGCDRSPRATCRNTMGSYACTCPEGYEDPEGKDCQDIDDCAANTDDCDDEPNACVDEVGGYRCECPAGYSDVNGDGSECADIDECGAGMDLCDDAPAAHCENTVGSYACSCPAGSTDPVGNGYFCTEPRTRVALGGRHACVIVEGGDVVCWGHNNKGQLGIGTTSGRNEAIGDRSGETGAELPVVDIGGPAIELAAGCSHTCALTPDGEVKCWGNNDFGQLGVGDSDARGDGPDEMGDDLEAVPLPMPAIGITLGCNFSCALLEEGDVMCWGDNAFGQLGQGNDDDLGDDPGELEDLEPIALRGAVKAVRAGFRFVCAQLANDDLQCWGRNGSGQLGLNDTDHRGDEPNEMGMMLPVVNLGMGRKAKAFATGYTHVCALLDNDAVKCWGGESEGGVGLGDPLINRGDGIAQTGEMTMGAEMGNNLPVIDLPGVAAGLSAERHTCVLFVDQTVGCFGNNGFGELGIGSTEARGDMAGEMGASFLKAPLGTGLFAVAVITGHEEGTNDANSCALLANGELKCWGANERGQLGLGDAEDRGDQADELGDALDATIDLW